MRLTRATARIELRTSGTQRTSRSTAHGATGLHGQAAMAKIRRGKKIERRRKKPQGKNIMSASATQGGHN